MKPEERFDYRDIDKRPCEVCGCPTVRTQRTADDVLLCQTCWGGASSSNAGGQRPPASGGTSGPPCSASNDRRNT